MPGGCVRRAVTVDPRISASTPMPGRGPGRNVVTTADPSTRTPHDSHLARDDSTRSHRADTPRGRAGPTGCSGPSPGAPARPAGSARRGSPVNAHDHVELATTGSGELGHAWP